jgi:hypothetical protein
MLHYEGTDKTLPEEEPTYEDAVATVNNCGRNTNIGLACNSHSKKM